MRACTWTKPLVGAALALTAAGSAVASPEPYEIVGDGVPDSLTGQAGDARNGRAVFVDRERGHCLLCHEVASMDETFQGTIGPDLTAVGDRLDAAQLRLRVIDPTQLNAETVMPAYYRVDGLHQVSKGYAGKPVLEAQEVEDVVAFLQSLREQAAEAQR